MTAINIEQRLDAIERQLETLNTRQSLNTQYDQSDNHDLKEK